MKLDIHSQLFAKIVLQGVLLNMVTPNMRGIACRVKNKKLGLFFLFEKKISDEDFDIYTEIETEAIAQYPDDYDLESKAISLDMSQKRFCKEGYEWVYLRKEKETDNNHKEIGTSGSGVFRRDDGAQI